MLRAAPGATGAEEALQAIDAFAAVDPQQVVAFSVLGGRADVGLMAIGPSQTRGPVTVDFDYFRVSGIDTTAPEVTATVNPAEPNGAAGWWTAPPTAPCRSPGSRQW